MAQYTLTTTMTSLDATQVFPKTSCVGKVVMRIPWFGWITLFMRDNPWGLPLVVALILLLVVVEFVLPAIKERKMKRPAQQNEMHKQS